MAAPGAAGPRAPFVTGDARVDALLARMTLAEKLSLIHDSPEDPRHYQGQAGYVAGVPRLGIPGLRLADGPPGVLTRHPSQALTATLGVAATFDLALARENGVVIGRQARALGIDIALQPYVNIDRDLAFKRAFNTFGEDPFLTSRMGAAEISGIQSQRVMAMAKHFIGFDSAGSDQWIDDQVLHQVYLPPFEAAVQAGVAGVMCAYNHVNGPHACGNAATLTGILRDELGFKGFVTSDWGATHSAAFMNAGLDMEMIDGPDSTGAQEPAFLGARPAAMPASQAEPLGDLYGGQVPEEDEPAPPDGDDLGAQVEPKTLAQALADGSVTEATVTRAAGRVLFEMHRFGLLDGSASVEARHRVSAQAIAANAKLIERTGEEAAVLLKNEGGALPLKPADLDEVVLIGPTAAQVDAIGISGERGLGLPARQVGPLQAMRQLSGRPHIRFAVADDMTGVPIPAALLSHDGQPGLLRSGPASGRSRVQIDPLIDFTQQAHQALKPNTEATWTGTLSLAEAGRYWLYLQALGTNASLWVDGKPVALTGAFAGDVHGDILQANQDNVLPTTDGLDNVRVALDLAAGAHDVRVHIHPDSSNAPVQVRLAWATPARRQADLDAAIAAARQAKTAVVFAWTRRAPAFRLPGDQNALIEQVAAVNPHTIVVLNSSQPVALPWRQQVQAILEMWWPGDEGGWATAKLLLGRTSPSGRLPVTWAERLQDYPATDPQHPERSGDGVNHRTTYSEGVDVGYRWFDRQKIEPLYAFGHGLSYTRFEYSALQATPATDGGVDLQFQLRNSGGMAGDEVPQVYLSAPERMPEGAVLPLRQLAAFDRVHLAPGATKRVALHLDRRAFEFWSSVEKGWVRAPGPRTLSVGASSRDVRLVQRIEMPVAP
jgi:beta-glucosidase